MSEALNQQLQLKYIIERTIVNFKKLPKPKVTPPTVRSRMTVLKETWAQFVTGHSALMTSVTEALKESLVYFKEAYFEATEDLYLTTLDHMAETLETLQPTVSANQSLAHNRSNASLSLAHLPSIQLPPFDGNYNAWESFRDRFTALIINNTDLDDFSRMHYLHSSLIGRALDAIANLPVTSDNFELAWQSLVSRYENRRRLINLHLSSLLSLPTLSRESACEMQVLRDQVNIAVSSLVNLRRSPSELWNDILVHIIVQKLDPNTRKSWNLKTSDSDEPTSIDELHRFLESRTRALEEFDRSSPVKPATKTTPVKLNVATASPFMPSECPLCKLRHYLSACPSFTSRNPGQRLEIVKQLNRCFNCLSQTHSVKECSSKYSCRTCQQKHHTLLHMSSSADSPASIASAAPSSPDAGEPPQLVQSLCASKATTSRAQVLLATAWVTIGTPSGRAVVIRALIDPGSQMTLISENVAQLLRSTRIRAPVSVLGVGGVHVGTYRHATEIHLSPRNARTPSVSTTAFILKNLTSYVPKYDANLATYSHLSDLPWADPDPTSADPINVIIGADVYGDIMLSGFRKNALGQPTAQRSIFGWIISGPVGANREHVSSISTDASLAPSSLCSFVHHCRGLSIEEELRRFWEVEELPHKPSRTVEEEACEEHFQSTHSRSEDGRYIVRLPFKTKPPLEIGESRPKAERLLRALSRRLQKSSEQAAEYSEFLAEYSRLGHMRVASISPTDREHVYIPHHPVIRDSSSTTHLRVVFNGSSSTTNGTSLNDHLHAGPKLQAELPAVILKWRQFRFVYTSDIAKMYRQIRVDSRDVDYQRILWLQNNSAEPVAYQLLTVTYGLTCAPFLALRVIKQLIDDEGTNFPLAVSILRDNIYVDDLLFGDDDLNRLRQTRDQLISLLRRGGFELRKWASNSPLLLSDIDAADHGLACHKSLSADENLKILGIGWNPSSDVFQLQVSLAASAPTSKRSILSAIAKLYDPLGWVTPVTIAAKIFMQQLWRENLNWDEMLNETLLARWRQIYSHLSVLDGLHLPRWTGNSSDTQEAEIHGFADASNVAYAAVVYLRLRGPQGEVTVSLLAGKSRVAPLATLSIPRLELSAAVLLAKLMEFILDTLKLNQARCVCWTDSTIVLAWLRQSPSRWKTFVANRVADVQARLPNVEWRHVPTDSNPADCASRGILGDELVEHSLWWHGPSWLLQDADDWPSTTVTLAEEPALEEKSISIHHSHRLDPLAISSRFSSWAKLIRVTAYVFKFVNLCRRSSVKSAITDPRGGALTSQECQSARIFWLQHIQKELFPNEILALSQRHSLSAKSPILALTPFLDNDGVLRVGGRLNNAPFPASRRQPILLSSHPLVRLLITQIHEQALHAGLQLTLSTLRREFWVLRARSLVKTIIHHCVRCVRERASTPSQLMGNLPVARVSAPSRCFLHCGVDYAGPVQVRASAGRGITARKAYIALFVCLASKAVHLELVSDYSTSAFLHAYARFCSRRGLPESMYSDNGTTFVGADREMIAAYRSAVRDPQFQNRTALDNVSWNFIPPSAPHFGGLWEAGVRSVKFHLRRVIGTHTLTFEEFATLLCRVEACLNSRPIAPLSDNVDDYDVLTPGHLLIGSAITVHPEPSLLNINENRLTRWQLVNQLTEQFWKQWYNDYVNTLQQRGKWRKPQPPIKPGQLVLLKNPLLPPCKWELGRVTLCHPGSDGLTRVVTVKTATSEYRRPIVKLCILPVDCSGDST